MRRLHLFSISWLSFVKLRSEEVYSSIAGKAAAKRRMAALNFSTLKL